MLMADSHIEQGVEMFSIELIGVLKVLEGPIVDFQTQAKAGNVKGEGIVFANGKVAVPDLI